MRENKLEQLITYSNS